MIRHISPRLRLKNHIVTRKRRKFLRETVWWKKLFSSRKRKR
jgi:hypothetical protein